MKISLSMLTVALFAQSSVASWGLSKAIYNKWHQTELERWLADHDIAYPAASDRKDLENLVRENWETNVVTPYSSWDPQAQADWLANKGVEVTEKQKANKDWLGTQLKKKWYETESVAEEGYGNVKTWIFDTWTESALKAFLDYHNIPNPSPRTRDSLISTARNNYATIATKVGETAAYPGDWLYQSWSESQLKEWLDTHGYPVPQTSSRDKLIAAVRKNSRQAGLKYEDTKKNVAETTFNSWSDSDLKAWCDKNGIPVPQNGKRDEILASARKNYYSLVGDTYSASVTSAYNRANGAYGAATSSVGNVYQQATDSAGSVISAASATVSSVYSEATDMPSNLADAFMATWSETRLKAYLDSRGVPVPQNGKKDELVALARLHKHKAANSYGAWTFDTWTVENLKNWLKGQGKYVEGQAAESRVQLSASAASVLSSASATGGTYYASVTSALSVATDAIKDAPAQATDAAKAGKDTLADTTFDTWSDSDLKAYLDSWGVQTYQGTTKNELVAKARRYNHIFKSGFKSESAAQRYERQLWSAVANIQTFLGLAGSSVSSGAASAATSLSKNAPGYASSVSSAASVASKSASSAAVVASKSASSAASVASKSGSSAASIVSKHASSAKSEL